MAAEIATITGLPFRAAPNKFEALSPMASRALPRQDRRTSMPSHIDPERDQFDAFKALPRDQPIEMINLIAFREHAD